MSELVSNINRRIDSIAATEKLRMLTTEEINCQSLLKQLADSIAELEKERNELIKLVHAIRWQLEISDARYDTGHKCWTDMIEVADKHSPTDYMESEND